VAATAYTRLEERFRQMDSLGGAEAVLHWDLATMMPPGGTTARADQLAAVKAVRHDLMTRADVADWLADAAGDDTLDLWQRSNLREMARLHAHATALSPAQVDALSRATSACEAAWRDARAAGDFATVLPALDALLAQVRETALAKSERLGLAPYDALLDAYEPGGRCADIDRIFGDLVIVLDDVLPQVLERQARDAPVPEFAGPFPFEKQRRLAVRLMETLGFDFRHGRLDISLHPFCGGTPDDVRVTTRYDEADFQSALMGVLHETGHALYERGLPAAWRGQPVGEARGMAMHESQSLLMEMQVCRSREFLTFAAPLLAETLKNGTDADERWSADTLYRHYTRVTPGLIRVDADEVTYPFHVILRYDLERAMIAADLKPADLPGAWNDGVERHLGIRPPGDRLGCLQDIHWYDGAWGYFPTYTLGALAAAQLFAAAVRDRPEIPGAVARGEFTPLLDWLRLHVHGQASVSSGNELLTAATGSPLGVSAFADHLRRRYLA
jgi:carboxypeptidase Taq